MSHIGTRVRALRETMSLSLRDLAQRSGVSAPMLSQVERGETSPTLAVAERIASGLDLSLSQLVRLDEAPPIVVTRAAERTASGDDEHGWELLSPEGPGHSASVSRHVLQPGGQTHGAPMHGAGSREFALVQEGSIDLELDGGHHPLAVGDSVTFDADLPHRIANPGADRAVFISVVTAGLRRA